MTCDEFERVLPELEGEHTFEREAHLRSCSTCSDLVSDLNAISVEARRLVASEEPNSRVWNSIEIALRNEGLIRQPLREPSLTAAPAARGRLAWLIPLAAAFLVAFGVLMYQRGGGPQLAQQQLPRQSSKVMAASLQSLEDQQLLKLVSGRAPSMRSAYEADLRTVEDYIRDAEQSARNNPNDEASQLYLMNAYEQRAMVYEMALDRSLP